MLKTIRRQVGRRLLLLALDLLGVSPVDQVRLGSQIEVYRLQAARAQATGTEPQARWWEGDTEHEGVITEHHCNSCGGNLERFPVGHNMVSAGDLLAESCDDCGRPL